MKSTAVVFTAYNRPEYLERTVYYWQQVRNLNKVDVYFYVDPSDVTHEIFNIASQLTSPSNVRVNPNRLGVMTNPFFGINATFDKGYHRLVIWEDDVIPSTDVLEYFDWALTEVESSPCGTVLGACAFSSQTVTNIRPDASLAWYRNKFDPLGWGITYGEWKRHVEPWWFEAAQGNSDGSEHGWDWGMNRITERSGLKWITPSESRSDHIGVYGTHMTPEIYHTRRGVEFVRDRPSLSYLMES